MKVSQTVISKIEATKQKRIGVGQGRNSEVFLCHDPQLGGPIVLKEIPLKEFNHPDEYFREAKALYTNSHPNVVPVLYAGKDVDFVRIAMPYYDKGSLQDKLAVSTIPAREIIRISQEFLSGLHHVHINNFIHFDIKPSNILFNDRGNAVLADFGQSRMANNLGVSSVPPLYIRHIPPEALQYSHVTKQADIYQAALTLYRMCNGSAFFDNQKITSDFESQIIDGKFPRRDKFLPHVPKRLKTIIRKALSVDPGYRYQTSIELADELGQINSLLDWQYYQRQDKHIWLQTTSDHEYFVEIVFLPNNRFEVSGRVIRRHDQLQRKRKAWCRGEFATLKQAFNSVNEIFRELEGGK